MSHSDKPWLSRTFQHENLREWVQKNRSQLLGAALTIIRAWLATGRPPSEKNLGMFENWSRVMGGILNHAGIPGFLENQEDFYQTVDPEEQAWLAFLGLWWIKHKDEKVGVTALFVLSSKSDPPLDLGSGQERSQKWARDSPRCEIGSSFLKSRARPSLCAS
jgi:putative DNA primase/helicase